MRTKYVVTRDVGPDEVAWLQRVYKQGEMLYQFTGATYGCIDWSKGIAVSEVEGENPFFEFPHDALMVAP